MSRQRSSKGVWPTGNGDGRVPEDGRSWISFDSWLRSHGSSLPERVAILRGYPNVEFTREIIVAANKVVISKTGERASQGTRDGLGLPEGKTWPGAFQWMLANGIDHNELLGRRHVPWSRDLLVGYILAHNEKTGVWPSSRSDALIYGDTRSWAVAAMWLKKNFGCGLAELVDEVSGRKRPDNLSMEQIRSLVRASLKRGENPTNKFDGEIPNHPGLKWQAIDAVLKRKFNSTLQCLRDEIKPPPVPFTLAEFRTFLNARGIASLPDYQRLWRAGKLDGRCPGKPHSNYRMGWREIVGTKVMPYEDFREAIQKIQRGLERPLTREEYKRMRREGKLSPGCPSMPPKTYKKTWGEITGQKAIPSVREIRAYCASAGIEAWSRYKIAYESGSLPEGFPSTGYLRTRNFAFAGSARAKGAQHHNVRVSEAAIRQVHAEIANGGKTRQEIADALKVSLKLVKDIRSGRHWSCRKAAP